MAFEKKLSIDYYLEGNQLNAKLYQTLLFLQDNDDNGRKTIKVNPLVIFNRVYEICDVVKNEAHPEELAGRLWQHTEEEFISDEVNVIYACVYVVLSFTGSGNPNMVFFLTRLKQMVDSRYMSVFEPLLEEELTDIPPLPKSFARLKSQGDKIEDLNDRELFYTEYLTRYKQAKSKGNILQQIEDEISLTKRTRELTLSPVSPSDPSEKTKGSNKIKTALIIEMLGKLGHGKNFNDLTKICRLVAYLTGGSYEKLYNDAQAGIQFTDYHKKELSEVNKILADLSLGIELKKDKEY